MEKSNRNYNRTLYAAEKNDIDFALAGEALISQGLSCYTWGSLISFVAPMCATCIWKC